MHLLQRITQTFRVTVVITNHIHTIPEPLAYTSDSKKPVGGRFMRYTITYVYIYSEQYFIIKQNTSVIIFTKVQYSVFY